MFVSTFFQVCSHIVSAIHREAIKIKHEFDMQTALSLAEVQNENNRSLHEGIRVYMIVFSLCI